MERVGRGNASEFRNRGVRPSPRMRQVGTNEVPLPKEGGLGWAGLACRPPAPHPGLWCRLAAVALSLLLFCEIRAFDKMIPEVPLNATIRPL